MTSTIGGTLLRMAMGSTPFLLALLLQIGFGMSPLEAGLITFTSAAGALLMKTTARPIIAWFGFKNVLVWNTIITGVIFMGYGLFTIDTPHWLIIATLLVGGFFRSLQFTALNTLAYADVDQHAHEPRLQPRQHGPAAVAEPRHRLRRHPAQPPAPRPHRCTRCRRPTSRRPSSSSARCRCVGVCSSSLPLPRDVGAEVSGRQVAGDPACADVAGRVDAGRGLSLKSNPEAGEEIGPWEAVWISSSPKSTACSRTSSRASSPTS